jgi:hypothetical protein
LSNDDETRTGGAVERPPVVCAESSAEIPLACGTLGDTEGNPADDSAEAEPTKPRWHDERDNDKPKRSTDDDDDRQGRLF